MAAPSPSSNSHPSKPPAWVEENHPQGTPVRLGRYLLGPLLGQGGMGRVFEAWDPFLKRVVALKVLYRDSPEAMLRFVQEAEFQARMHHPNIGPIFEVDLSGEQPLIAMQRIQGPSLEEARKKLSLEALLDILEASARAVHAAHEAGLIHRDLKPSNILLEVNSYGCWHPYVMDFGLAKDLGTPFTSHTQMGIGTPAFAAPEQAEGLPADARSDVYGLGATLYMALTGVPPMEATTLPELRKALENTSPVPLRRRVPALPKDLDTLVSTCLARNPSDRYPSALALAEDLERFRTGRPLQARPLSLLERALRWLRKRRRPMLVGAFSASLVAVAGAWMLHRLQTREQQIILIQRYGHEAEQVEGTLRAIQRQPRHDLGPELAQIRTQVHGLKTEVERLDSSLAAPGHLALGRMFLALDEVEEALAHFWKAQALGDRSPQLAQSLGCALGIAYDRELQATRLSAGAGGRQALEDRLRQRYLVPIETLLDQAMAGSDTLFLKALLAHYRGQEEEAIRLAQETMKQSPGRTEATALLAEAHLGRARQRQKAQDPEGARQALETAVAALTRAQSLAPSDPALPCLEADAWTLRGLMTLTEHQPENARLEFHRALACANGALELQPSAPGTRLRLARGHYFLGIVLEDATEELIQAETWAGRLIQAHQHEGEAQRLLGRTLLLRAETQVPRSDTEALLRRSIHALDRAAVLGQPAEESKVRALLMQAKISDRRGEASGKPLEQALQVAESAQATWGDGPALASLAEALAALAKHKERRGEDATALRAREKQVRTEGERKGMTP